MERSDAIATFNISKAESHRYRYKEGYRRLTAKISYSYVEPIL